MRSYQEIQQLANQAIDGHQPIFDHQIGQRHVVKTTEGAYHPLCSVTPLTCRTYVAINCWGCLSSMAEMPEGKMFIGAKDPASMLDREELIELTRVLRRKIVRD